MTRRAWLLLGILLLVEGLLVAGVFVSAPHTGGDNAGYIALADALRSGEGYTEVWDPAAPPHTKYPPVFPLLLALAVAVGARGWVAFKLVPALAALVVAAGTFVWARERLGDEAGFGVALLVGMSPSLLYHSHWVLSDVPFLAFTVLALWMFERVLRGGRRGGEGQSGNLSLAAAALLVAMAYFTRSAGLPLVAAVIGALALRRDTRGGAVVGVTVGVPALLWLLRARVAGPGEGRYGSEFFLLDPYQPDLGPAGLGDFATRITDNLAGYGVRFLPETVVGGQGGLFALLVGALVLVAAWGWMRALRRGPGVAELFLPLYGGLILLWPQVWSGDRFALPLVPLLLVFAVEGARELARSWSKTARGGLLLACGILVALPAGRDWIAEREQAALCNAAAARAGPWACGGAALVDFVATAEWAGQNLGDGSAALTRKPRIWYLTSGIPTRTYPFSERPGALRAAAGEARAEYVVLDFVGNQGVRYVGAALGAEPGAFCLVGAFGGNSGVPATRLLRLMPPGRESGSRVEEGQIRLASCPVTGDGSSAPEGPVEFSSSWRIPILDR